MCSMHRLGDIFYVLAQSHATRAEIVTLTTQRTDASGRHPLVPSYERYRNAEDMAMPKTT